MQFRTHLRASRAACARSLHCMMKKRFVDLIRDAKRGGNAAAPESARAAYRHPLTPPERTPLALPHSSPLDLEAYRVGRGVIESVYYIPDFVTQGDEAALLSQLYDGDGSGWTALRSRRLRVYDRARDGGGLAPFPEWLVQLCEHLMRRGAFPGPHAPDHALINEYRAGQGIMPHTDGPCYHPAVATLSLGAPCVMHFSPKLAPHRVGEEHGGPVASLVLQPRSLVVFTGPAYTDMLHGIDAAARDLVGGVAPVLNLYSAPFREGDVISRGDRVSITLRCAKPAAEAAEAAAAAATDRL